MAYLNLDKTYTLRPILWRTVLVLAVLSVLYFCLRLRRDWDVAMGGVTVYASPYKSAVPAECLKISGGHSGYGLATEGLMAFKPRTFVIPLQLYIDRLNCSGYSILTGLHGDYWASYRIIFTGSDGQPIAIETVEYLKK
jgi:hypothetical protein